GMGAALRALLEDDAARHDLSTQGLERAGRFTWARCVDETLAVYRKVRAHYYG
ncbi:MAG: hypothetical protein H6R26_1432, partial [Proteobacteria bacterium]|nr:hypothetical protein [Pseudomonadota bacterium]